MSHVSEDYWHFENITVGPFDVFIEGGWNDKDEEMFFINADTGGEDDGSFNVCFVQEVGILAVRREVQVMMRRRLTEWAAQVEKII